MERAPKLTPQSERGTKDPDTQVQELAVLASELEASMARRGLGVEMATISVKEEISPDYATNEGDVENFEPGESVLDPQSQEALRNTLRDMHLLSPE